MKKIRNFITRILGFFTGRVTALVMALLILIVFAWEPIKGAYNTLVNGGDAREVFMVIIYIIAAIIVVANVFYKRKENERE